MHTIDQIILAHVTKKSGLMKDGLYCTWLTPYPSVLDFCKIQFEKSSSTNWIFASYTGSKNPVQNRLKTKFVELDFSKTKYR